MRVHLFRTSRKCLENNLTFDNYLKFIVIIMRLLFERIKHLSTSQFSQFTLLRYPLNFYQWICTGSVNNGAYHLYSSLFHTLHFWPYSGGTLLFNIFRSFTHCHRNVGWAHKLSWLSEINETLFVEIDSQFYVRSSIRVPWHIETNFFFFAFFPLFRNV